METEARSLPSSCPCSVCDRDRLGCSAALTFKPSIPPSIQSIPTKTRLTVKLEAIRFDSLDSALALPCLVFVPTHAVPNITIHFVSSFFPFFLHFFLTLLFKSLFSAYSLSPSLPLSPPTTGSHRHPLAQLTRVLSLSLHSVPPLASESASGLTDFERGGSQPDSESYSESCFHCFNRQREKKKEAVTATDATFTEEPSQSGVPLFDPLCDLSSHLLPFRPPSLFLTSSPLAPANLTHPGSSR